MCVYGFYKKIWKMKFYKDKWGRLYNEDCLKTLSKIADNSIGFFLTDPPY